MLRWIYSGFFFAMLPVVFMRLAIRGFRDRFYWKGWNQRLGKAPALKGVLWVHAVSMGETICILPLVRRYMDQHGPDSVFFTTMTATAAAYLKKHLPQVPQAYIPYDIPWLWQRFFRRGTPRMLVLVETELWPNLLHACNKRKIPVFIANARLSARSASRYKHLSKNYWKPIAMVAAQTQTDLERYRAIGIPIERIVRVGNLKFDLTISPNVRTAGEALRSQWPDRLVWIAASTHDREETAALEAHALIRRVYPQSLLIIVPRHPERFERVYSLIQKHGETVARRSTAEPCTPDTTVYLVDTLGELLSFYGAVDVAFVGGSIAPMGGHNPLEPAAFSVPILMGPEVFNCQHTVEMLMKVGGLRQISAETLGAAVLAWFQDAPQRQAAGQSAYQVFQENKGALSHTLMAIEALIAHPQALPPTRR